MPTISLVDIHCYDPRGVRDDVRLRATCDGGEWQTIWGPERMRTGNTVDLTHRIEGVEYSDTATIKLIGDLGHDFGSVSFDDHSAAGDGEYFFPGELNANYRVRFRVDPMPVAGTRGRIRLVRLTCNDAQGAHDEVTLSVNGHIVLGPMHHMKTGWHVDFEGEEIDFNHACTLTLSETYGQDWSRNITLTVGRYVLGADSRQFAADSGITGDARYTLEYEMLA